MRQGANRAFGYAVLASLVLHAALFAALPELREFSALIPPEPEPLIARVERPKPPPPPVAAPAPEPPAVKPAPRPKPAPKPKPAPTPAAEPRPAPEPATPAPLELPPPAAPAAPAPLPKATEPPVTAEPAAAPLPAPLTRVHPRLLAPEARSPDAGEAGVLERYREDVVSAAARFKRYPRVAIDNNWEGEVLVRMAIGADGRIASLAVLRGSGYEVLDRQALQMFRNAKPFVPIPAALRGQPFEVELRAIYSLRDQGSG